VGFAVSVRAVLCAGLLAAALGTPAAAADRYALVVTGASGGAEHAQRFETWRATFVTVLQKLGYEADHVRVLGEVAEPGIGAATAEEVGAVIRDLASRAEADDIVLVLLIGHGTVFEGDDAKFNLVGPDMTAAEWAERLASIPGRLVFVNTAAGSHEFLRVLAREGRIVVSATDTSSQRYATRFPGFFVGAFADAAADLDKNGRVSIWEAFTYASAGVRRSFESEGRLATERALLDDNGDGRGREADGEGDDGTLSQLTYLQTENVEAEDPETRQLLEQRQTLVDAVDRLRLNRANMAPAAYDAELERLLLELARVDRELRTRP
jgi:hypothetical protein